MKSLIKLITLLGIFVFQIEAQQGEADSPENSNPEILKMRYYLGNYANPGQVLPDHIVKEYCDYMNTKPILREDKGYPNDDVGMWNSDVAEFFIKASQNPTQKKLITETIVNYLKRIQAMRNEIGLDFSDARFQEEHPMQGISSASIYGETEQGRAQRHTEENWKNAKVGNIWDLASVYSYFYQKLEESKLVSMEKIPKKLKYIESAEAKKKRELNKAQQNVVESPQETPSTTPLTPTDKLDSLSEEKQQAQSITLTKADTTKSVATNNDLNAERKIVSPNPEAKTSQSKISTWIFIATGLFALLIGFVCYKKKRE
jgi:hypothetical protein